MKQRLTWSDTLGLGLMIFSFFLGAGNLIFPPLAGQLAGWQVGWALSGFVFSGVLLPLATLVAIAYGGSFSEMMAFLPKGIKVAASLIIFSLIGPLLITPRTGVVAYNLAFKPLCVDAWYATQAWITAAFFMLALLFCWRQSSLLDYIGKLVTPLLFVLLTGLTVGVLLMPQGVVQAPQAAYQAYPLIEGLIEGYQTMDMFGALMFGTLIIKVLHDKGVTDFHGCRRYLVSSAVIAAVGLTLVYVSLFWLGATSAGVAPQAENGTQILTAYVQALFGGWGQGLLAVVVLLACLTTAVGLLSGFADYLSNLTIIPYHWVLIFSTLLSAWIANVELTTLITVAQPILFALYPVAITLVLLTLIRKKLPNPAVSYRLALSVAFLSGLLDALRLLGINLSALHFIPGFAQGVGWVMPLALLLLLLCFLPAASNKAATAG